MKNTIMILMLLMMLSSCSTNYMYVSHYYSDHNNMMRILDMDGNVLDEEFIKDCGRGSSSLRHEDVTFKFGGDFDSVIIQSPSYGYKKIQFESGHKYDLRGTH